jgi:hypothetical protein
MKELKGFCLSHYLYPLGGYRGSMTRGTFLTENVTETDKNGILNGRLQFLSSQGLRNDLQAQLLTSLRNLGYLNDGNDSGVLKFEGMLAKQQRFCGNYGCRKRHFQISVIPCSCRELRIQARVFSGAVLRHDQRTGYVS